MRAAPGARRYDVAVVGGGPAGCVAATAFARAGANVIVLEAAPRACTRFAGEWIHPSGAAVLERQGLDRLDGAAPRLGQGFVVFPEDGSAPIVLPYPGGARALVCEHRRLVTALRGRAADVPGVDYGEARVVGVAGDTVRVAGAPDVRAGCVVGADGRASTIRRALGFEGLGVTLSYMASVGLRDVALPFEGFGHIVLGGPGPMLLYRVDDDTVRACVDVPLTLGEGARTPEFLASAFGPSLPGALGVAFRRAALHDSVAWAVTRARPRRDFGIGHARLVGDAVGHCHPMTAVGLSHGFLDAEDAAGRPRLDDYRRGRHAKSSASELLAGAFYDVFGRQDAHGAAIRQSVYRRWRASERERERTMLLLMGTATRARLGAALLRVVAGAVLATLTAHAPRPNMSVCTGWLAATCTSRVRPFTVPK